MEDILKRAQHSDNAHSTDSISVPPYDPRTHYRELAKSEYYRVLITLRHYLKATVDAFFLERDARNVDLYMLSPSVSSPMGKGSDSEALPMRFGELETFLVDSAQFGFEPLLLNDFREVYCYLPSMRGEDPDARHLNQFYHCECEIRGDLTAAMQTAELLFKAVARFLVVMEHSLLRISVSPEASLSALKRVCATKEFPQVTLEKAVAMLAERGVSQGFVTISEGVYDLTPTGESALASLLGGSGPVWVTHHCRDRVPFYQKPDPANPDQVLNADLLVPSLAPNGFAGEVIGLGERQTSAEEMRESLRRQEVNAEPYEWYITLRSLPGYQTTSGFGLGIERLLAWALGASTIRDVALYPRLKNIHTTP